MYPIHDPVEAESVTWVFSLTGGELESSPLRYAYRSDTARFVDYKFQPGFKRGWIRYWYDGSPEYVAREHGRLRGSTITLVSDCSFGGPPSVIYARGKRYRRIAQFVSSGETECPGKDCEEPIPEGERCPLCEGDASEGHGYIYLGDGWAESVYYCRD